MSIVSFDGIITSRVKDWKKICNLFSDIIIIIMDIKLKQKILIRDFGRKRLLFLLTVLGIRKHC